MDRRTASTVHLDALLRLATWSTPVSGSTSLSVASVGDISEDMALGSVASVSNLPTTSVSGAAHSKDSSVGGVALLGDLAHLG